MAHGLASDALALCRWMLRVAVNMPAASDIGGYWG